MKKVVKKVIILIVLINMLINTLFVNSSFATTSTVDYLTPRKHGGLSDDQRLNIINVCNFFISREGSKINGTPRFPLIYCVTGAGVLGKARKHSPTNLICKNCFEEVPESGAEGGRETIKLKWKNDSESKTYYNDPVLDFKNNVDFKSFDEVYFTYCNHYARIVYRMILGTNQEVTRPHSYIKGLDKSLGDGYHEYHIDENNPIEYIPIFDKQLAEMKYPGCVGTLEEAKDMDPTDPYSAIRIYPGDVLVTNLHVQIYLGENVSSSSIQKEEGKKYKGHAAGHNVNVLIGEFNWENILNSGEPGGRGPLEYCGIVRVREGFGEKLENNKYDVAISNLGDKQGINFRSIVDDKINDYEEITEVIYDDGSYTTVTVNNTAASKEVEVEKDEKEGFSFSKVIDTILGIMFLIPKVIIVGWTGLMQKLVITDLVNAISGTSLVGNLTVEKIIFDKVPLLSINFFDITNEIKEDYPVIYIIRDNMKSWYNGIRYLGIAGMLITLIYVGIRMTLTSIAEEKGKYKKMFKDWAISFIMLFVIHYIMIGIITLNEQILQIFSKGVIDEGSLFDQILVRAYDLRISVGLPATIMYVILVVFTILYLFAYLKRFFTIAILTIFAPIVAISYAIDKVKDGKSQTYGVWLKEYIYNVLIQSIHAIIYTIFISTSIEIALSGMTTNSNGEVVEVSSVWNALIANMVPAVVFMIVSLRLDKIFRSIFTFSNSKTQEDVPSTFEEIASAAYVAKNTTMGVVKTGGKILTAPVRVPYKAISKVAYKLDKRPSYEKEANPKGIGKFDKNVKAGYKELSDSAKEVLQGVRQAFPKSILGWNSVNMVYRMGVKPVKNFIVANKNFTVNQRKEDFYKQSTGVNSMNANKNVFKATNKLKDSFNNSFLTDAIATTIKNCDDLPSGIKAELTSNQTMAIKDFKEANEKLQEVKRLEKKLELCKNEVKKWAKQEVEKFMEKRSEAKKVSGELEKFYSKHDWEDKLSDEIKKICMSQSVNMPIFNSTKIGKDWIKEVKHEYIDRNEIEFNK